jgi:hypothetical protein
VATVIDSLVVLLNLDASKFTVAQKKALEDLRKTKETAAGTAKDMEASGKQAAQFFGILRNEALRTFAAFTGFKGMSSFVVDTVNGTAAMGRLAHNIGLTTKEVGLWENAVRLLGGDAGAAGESMKGLTQEFARYALTGRSEVIPYFRALGVAINDPNTGKLKTFVQLMLDLADGIKRTNVSTPQANFMLHAMGIDQGSINLILQGREEIEKLIGTVQKQGVANDADAKSLQHLQTSLISLGNAASSVGRSIVVALGPATAAISDFFTSALNHSREGGTGVFTLNNALGIDFYNRYLKGLFSGQGSSSGLSVFDLFQKLENSPANAVSPKGARGRNQIKPSTAEQYGFDPSRLNEPAYNDMVARAIEADLNRRYHGDIDAMAIAYNAGPGRADEFLRNGRNLASLPKETQAYVARERAIVGGAGASVTNIGTIVVNTRATDASGIAVGIRGALSDNGSLATQANKGPQ